MVIPWSFMSWPEFVFIGTTAMFLVESVTHWRTRMIKLTGLANDDGPDRFKSQRSYFSTAFNLCSKTHIGCGWYPLESVFTDQSDHN
jgi:hypothetical protein